MMGFKLYHVSKRSHLTGLWRGRSIFHTRKYAHGLVGLYGLINIYYLIYGINLPLFSGVLHWRWKYDWRVCFVMDLRLCWVFLLLLVVVVVIVVCLCAREVVWVCVCFSMCVCRSVAERVRARFGVVRIHRQNSGDRERGKGESGWVQAATHRGQYIFVNSCNW